MIKAKDISAVLGRLKGYSGIYVPEFTWWKHTDCVHACDGRGDLHLNSAKTDKLRIDGLLLDTSTRLTHGFEIKTDVWDWHRDKKWQRYAEFCSTLSIACPEGMIDTDELPPHAGLLWINKMGQERWCRRPRAIPHEPAAWAAVWLKILENELPRLHQEVRALKAKKYAAKPAPRST